MFHKVVSRLGKHTSLKTGYKRHLPSLELALIIFSCGFTSFYESTAWPTKLSRIQTLNLSSSSHMAEKVFPGCLLNGAWSDGVHWWRHKQQESHAFSGSPEHWCWTTTSWKRGLWLVLCFSSYSHTQRHTDQDSFKLHRPWQPRPSQNELIFIFLR